MAYAIDACVHLLNVPAGKMSVFPDQPGHFVEWVRARLGRIGLPKSVSEDDFLPRSLYGEYIACALTEARQQADPSITFTVRIGAGSLVVLGVVLSMTVHPGFVWLAGFVGAGLVFAGATGFCGMAFLLAKAPWNRS